MVDYRTSQFKIKIKLISAPVCSSPQVAGTHNMSATAYFNYTALYLLLAYPSQLR